MTTATTNATTPDYDEIVRVVQLYLDGWKGDADKFREAFHEDAWIFFTDADGRLHNSLLTDLFERWAATGAHVEGRFLSVTQAGGCCQRPPRVRYSRRTVGLLGRQLKRDCKLLLVRRRDLNPLNELVAQTWLAIKPASRGALAACLLCALC